MALPVGGEGDCNRNSLTEHAPKVSTKLEELLTWIAVAYLEFPVRGDDSPYLILYIKNKRKHGDGRGSGVKTVTTIFGEFLNLSKSEHVGWL